MIKIFKSEVVCIHSKETGSGGGAKEKDTMVQVVNSTSNWMSFAKARGSGNWDQRLRP